MVNPPAWLEQLASEVAELVCPVDPLSPLGCHVHYEASEDLWEVTVFASRTETFGGPQDGHLTSCRFGLDLFALCNLFTKITNCTWQPLPYADDDELGAHVAVEGTYAGHRVCLRILASAPDSIPAGRRVDVLRREVVEMW